MLLKKAFIFGLLSLSLAVTALAEGESEDLLNHLGFNKALAKQVVPAVEKQLKRKMFFTVTLSDAQGKPAPNTKATLEFSGKTEKLTTDAKGQVKIILTNDKLADLTLKYPKGYSAAVVVFPKLKINNGGGNGEKRKLPKGGILDKKAPKWEATDWVNLPAGKKSVDIEDYKGKVIYLYCFQSWCPGCHKSGFPTLKKMIDKYKNNKDVAFVSIQTVFEGFHTNTPDKIKIIDKKYGLNIPMAQSGKQEGDVKKRSPLMKKYRTRGTPWTIIIDKEGVVKFNGFHIKPDEAEKVINGLLK